MFFHSIIQKQDPTRRAAHSPSETRREKKFYAIRERRTIRGRISHAKPTQNRADQSAPVEEGLELSFSAIFLQFRWQITTFNRTRPHTPFDKLLFFSACSHTQIRCFLHFRSSAVVVAAAELCSITPPSLAEGTACLCQILLVHLGLPEREPDTRQNAG